MPLLTPLLSAADRHPRHKLCWWGCFFLFHPRVFCPHELERDIGRYCPTIANRSGCYPSNNKLMTALHTLSFTWILVIRHGNTLIPTPLDPSSFYKALLRNTLSRLSYSHDSSVPLSLITLRRPFHIVSTHTTFRTMPDSFHDRLVA